MHIHAQTKVDQMTMWLKKQRGHDQHAAITTTITSSIASSSPRFDLGACGSGRKLGRVGGEAIWKGVGNHSGQGRSLAASAGSTWACVRLDGGLLVRTVGLEGSSPHSQGG